MGGSDLSARCRVGPGSETLAGGGTWTEELLKTV